MGKGKKNEKANQNRGGGKKGEVVNPNRGGGNKDSKQNKGGKNKNQKNAGNNKNQGSVSSGSQACNHLQRINKEKILKIFEHKLFLKAIALKNALPKAERKTLEKFHPDVNWNKPSGLQICLICGQVVDEKHYNSHVNAQHCLFLDILNQRVHCESCEKPIPITQIDIFVQIFNLSQPEIKPQIQAIAPTEVIMARGLVNLGNSCWMNSTLQLLARIPLVAKDISESYQFATAFQRTSVELCKNGSVFKPSIFVHQLLAKFSYLSVYEQQDASEFVTMFLDALRDDLGGTPKNLSGNNLEDVKLSAMTSVDGTINFILDCEMKCELCETVSHIYQRTSILSMCVPFGASTTLEEIISDYFAEGSSADDWRCDSCNNTCSCSMIQRMKSTPKYLILHLARFRYTQDGFVKNNIQVRLPDTLDLKQYGATGSYELFGFVTHYGTMEGGHYTSVYHDSNKYILFDDSTVSILSKSDALSLQPYIIFYKNVPEEEE